MKALIVVVGASLEFAGIFLIASPELVPRLRRARATIERSLYRLKARIRRLLGRTKTVTASVNVSDSLRSSDRARALRTMGASGTVDDQLERLRRAVERLEQRLDDAEHEIQTHPGRWTADIERAKGEIESIFDSKLEATRDEYINRRLIGVFCVLAGVPLLAWANFL
jgi:chromosome segregation ATPase